MKNETAVFEGNVYQIGEYYLFSDDVDAKNGKWVAAKLVSISIELPYPINSDSGVHECIKPLIAGTVTPVPVELLDGAAYTFEYMNAQEIGLYGKVRDTFFVVGCSYNPEECTNIRKMVEDKR